MLFPLQLRQLLTLGLTINIRQSSIKKRLNKIFIKINKKYKSKFKINYKVSGEAFLTKPNKTTYMIQNIIKKITKIKPKLSTTGGTSDLRFIKTISPGLRIWFSWKNYASCRRGSIFKRFKKS